MSQKFLYETTKSRNSARKLSEVRLCGNSLKDAPCPMKRPKRKSPLTRRNLKRKNEVTLNYARGISTISRVSSANSNVSKAMTSRKPVKPQPLATRVRSNKSAVTPNTTAASSISIRSISMGKQKKEVPQISTVLRILFVR